MSNDGMTPARIKKLVETMRALDVAEFQYGDLKVKFFREFAVPGGAYSPGDDEDVPAALRESFNTHLEARDPSRSAEEYEKDLMWST